jgi:hypothetical protein
MLAVVKLGSTTGLFLRPLPGQNLERDKPLKTDRDASSVIYVSQKMVSRS